MQFFSGGATTRLLICLVLHTSLHAAAEVLGRASSSAGTARKLRRGELTFEQAEARIVQTCLPFWVTKAYMSFCRRLMLLNMGGPVETMAALVVASLEEAFSRGFIVEIDKLARRLTGRSDLEGDELKLQRLVWMCDANLSSIAEFNAILTATYAQVILQRHALFFALGYDPPGADGVVLDAAGAFAQLMVELTLEVMVDTTAMWVEGEHGIPVTEYFRRNSRLVPLVYMVGFSVCTLEVALYGFLRVPTFVTCPSSEYVCDCVEQPQYEGWYTDICAIANETGTSENTTSRAVAKAEVFANVDGMNILMAFVAGLAMLTLISTSALFARYQRKNRIVKSVAIAHASLLVEKAEAEQRIARAVSQNERLKQGLRRARKIVEACLICMDSRE